MPGNLEQLVLDILLKDRASEGLGRTSKAAALAGDNVSGLNKKLDETSRKTAEARVRLAGDKEAQAALDKMDARLLSLDRRVASPNLKIEGAARALAELSALDLELDKIGRRDGGSAVEAAGAMSALAGGAHVGGMAAVAAAGVALSPVIATLGAGLGGLGLAALAVSKNQELMRKELAPLKGEFTSFSKSLQPEVLAAFGDGIRIAGHLLHDIQPVAAATGKALDGVLGQVDRELSSGTWRQFFSFMATTAGPDIRLLGDNFTQLLHTLPAVVESLQPVATEMLTVTDNTLKLTGAIANFGKSTDKTSSSVGTNTGLLGFLSKAVANVTSFLHPGGVAAGALKTALDGIPASAGKAGGALGGTAGRARTLAQQLAADQAAVNALTAAENKSLSPLLAYTNSLITQSGDAAKLNDALKKSHDRIGLKTDAERASFSAANTYIQDLLNTAAAAAKSHQNLDQVIASLRAELPRLQGASSNTAGYSQTVQQLVGWLNRLKSIRAITEAIHVSGTGVWTVTPGKIGLPGGSAGGPFAAGGLVTAGSGPRSDDVIARVSRGELVVPASMVSAGFVDHLRGMLPGFAQGGVVGSWPQLPGMGPWAVRELKATEHAVARSVAQALIAALRQAAGGFGGGGGALGGDPAANRALAMRMFPWPAGMWAAFDYLEMREAGYNRFARNPSSGAYGLPQALPPTKMPFAAQAAGGSHAGAQLAWMFSYIRSVYGNPVNAAAHERGFNWYGAGLDAIISRPTLIGVGERGPERVTVTPAGRGGNIYITVNAPAGNGVEIGRQIAEYLKRFQKAGGKIHP